MAEEALKLTTYFGERTRSDGALLADRLIDSYERHGVRTSALFRAVEGFGGKHRLQTQRLLTLSEDLPVVAVAVDVRERIERLLPEVRAITQAGLMTLERAQLITSATEPPLPLAPGPAATGAATTLGAPGSGEAAEAAETGGTGETGEAGEAGEASELKLTIYVGRQERAATGRPAHAAVVELLHRRGIAGATVLLGVDGTARGVRERSRFFARNAQVPLMIISVGDRDRVTAALPELTALLADPLITVERVRVCKRDGVLLGAPTAMSSTTSDGQLGGLQKLTVYVGEQAQHHGRAIYSGLIRRLRQEGAAGATALRGLWGYHGDHEPHGERFWSVRRHAPILTVLIDTPENTQRWFEIVDQMTEQTGLVTCEKILLESNQYADAHEKRPGFD
jgi:PII-like signaling protein